MGNGNGNGADIPVDNPTPRCRFGRRRGPIGPIPGVPIILGGGSTKPPGPGGLRGLGVGGGGWVFRRCPTLPRPVGRSTIGAGGLSFRVRDGSGRFPSAVATGTPNHPHHKSSVVWCGGVQCVDASTLFAWVLPWFTWGALCGQWWCVGQVLGLLVPVH